MATDTWVDPARIEYLKQLWADGLTASQCAKQINRHFGCFISRNAVIAKIHRLGLAERSSCPEYEAAKRAIKKRRQKRAREQESKKRQAAFKAMNKKQQALRDLYLVSAPVDTAEEIYVPPEERKTLQQLERDDCRWPIGDPLTPDFHFCNRKRVVGLPYCEVHSMRAFQPPTIKRGEFVLESTADAVARKHARQEREKEAA